jgi:hypothetical protein
VVATTFEAAIPSEAAGAEATKTAATSPTKGEAGRQTQQEGEKAKSMHGCFHGMNSS